MRERKIRVKETAFGRLRDSEDGTNSVMVSVQFLGDAQDSLEMAEALARRLVDASPDWDPTEYAIKFASSVPDALRAA